MLFDIPETLNPRLAWMRKTGVQVFFNEGLDRPWECWTGNRDEAIDDEAFNGIFGDKMGTGPDEDAAITDWARKNNVKLWNEA